MRQLIGVILVIGALYFMYFAEEPKSICHTREDFVATSLLMVFEHKVSENMDNKMTKSEIARIIENDPRVKKIESEYATEEDFQAACDVLDEIIKSFDS